MKKGLLLFLLFLIFFPLTAFSFDIITKAWEQPKGILVDIHYRTFPFQQLLLTLKEQKFPIQIDYKFRIYKRRFFWKDKLLKEVRTEITFFYNPSENFYILKKENQTFKFEHPEDLLKHLLEMNSFFISFPTSTYNPKTLYVDEEIVIKFKTAFSEDLRRESNFRFVELTAHAKSKIFKKF